MRSDQAGAGPLPGSDAGRGSGRITAQTQERKAREQLKKPGAAALGAWAGAPGALRKRGSIFGPESPDFQPCVFGRSPPGPPEPPARSHSSWSDFGVLSVTQPSAWVLPSSLALVSRSCPYPPPTHFPAPRSPSVFPFPPAP